MGRSPFVLFETALILLFLYLMVDLVRTLHNETRKKQK